MQFIKDILMDNIKLGVQIYLFLPLYGVIIPIGRSTSEVQFGPRNC